MSFSDAIVDLRGSSVGMASHGNDANTYAEFRMEAVQNEFKTEQAGRPIFDEIPYITIHFVGDKTKQINRPVQKQSNGMIPSDLDRYPRQWDAFIRQVEQTPDGTPLKQWPLMSVGQIAELNGMKIYTVEALAQLPDAAVGFMGGNKLREQARSYLDRAGNEAHDTTMAAALANALEEIERLREVIRQFGGREQLEEETETDSPVRRPGRPRKIA